MGFLSPLGGIAQEAFGQFCGVVSLLKIRWKYLEEMEFVYWKSSVLCGFKLYSASTCSSGWLLRVNPPPPEKIVNKCNLNLYNMNIITPPPTSPLPWRLNVFG